MFVTLLLVLAVLLAGVFIYKIWKKDWTDGNGN